VAEQLSVADGAIVGTYLKAGGVFENKVDRTRVEQLGSQVREFRRTLA
jgi:predicted TIM-barrel enzyme